jgi:hypothetical protein
MTTSIDLLYDPNTTVGPLDEREVRAFEDWLHGSGHDAIHFEESYLAHIKSAHGAVPGKKYFRTARGTVHSVVRFLNFLGRGSQHPLAEYSVPCTWSAIDDRLGDSLMPFAELFGGDMLCFEFGKGPKAQIVVWFHELSKPNQPYTEFVSNDFEEFLHQLTEKTPGD